MTQTYNPPKENWIVTISRKEGELVVKLFWINGKKKEEVELNMTDIYDNKLHEYFRSLARSVGTSVNGYILAKNERKKE